MRRTYTKVQSFSSPESDNLPPLQNQFDQSLVPKVENLHQLQGFRISADRLFKIVDASIVAQKIGMKRALDAISPVTGSKSDWKFIHCYLDSTVLLLEACNNIQLRLERIRNSLDSIAIGLHDLDGEHETSKTILQHAISALESSRFRDKRHYSKMDKIMSTMRRFGRKLSRHTHAYQDINESISIELYKALCNSWSMAVLAIRVLYSATSIRSVTNSCVEPHKVEPRTMLFKEQRNKMKAFQKKSDDNPSMEELVCTDIASQTLLKLTTALQKNGSSSLRRMAVKAIAGELRRRKEVLEKILLLLEDKIEEFYQQIVGIRISMFGLLPKAQKEEMLEMVNHSSYEESQSCTNHALSKRGVARVKV